MNPRATNCNDIIRCLEVSYDANLTYSLFPDVIIEPSLKSVLIATINKARSIDDVKSPTCFYFRDLIFPLSQVSQNNDLFC